jgi:hypothetical protein
MVKTMVITGTWTCKKKDTADDGVNHYIIGFEIHEDYTEDKPPNNDEALLMQYSEIVDKLKTDKKSFVVKDDSGQNLELFEKNGSIILKRDNKEIVKAGNFRLNERYDPGRFHD